MQKKIDCSSLELYNEFVIKDWGMKLDILKCWMRIAIWSLRKNRRRKDDLCHLPGHNCKEHRWYQFEWISGYWLQWEGPEGKSLLNGFLGWPSRPRQTSTTTGWCFLKLFLERETLNTVLKGINSGFFPTRLMEGDVVSLLDGRLGSNANLEELIRAC